MSAAPGGGHVPGVLPASGQGKGPGRCSGTAGEARWPSRGADEEVTAPGCNGDAAPLRAPAGDRSGHGGEGAGGRVGDKEPSRRRESDSCVTVLLFVVSQTTLDSGSPGRRRGAVLPVVGVYWGQGRAGGGGAPGKGLGAHSRASPLRGARPYLSHRRPHRTVPAF